MKQFLNRRIWDKDNGISYFCTVCGQYRPEADFYKSKRSKWGVETKCKRHYTRRDQEDDNEDSHLKFTKLSEKDFTNARELLNKLGYDTSQDVHNQFLNKHKINKK